MSAIYDRGHKTCITEMVVNIMHLHGFKQAVCNTLAINPELLPCSNIIYATSDFIDKKVLLHLYSLHAIYVTPVPYVLLQRVAYAIYTVAYMGNTLC